MLASIVSCYVCQQWSAPMLLDATIHSSFIPTPWSGTKNNNHFKSLAANRCANLWTSKSSLTWQAFYLCSCLIHVFADLPLACIPLPSCVPHPHNTSMSQFKSSCVLPNDTPKQLWQLQCMPCRIFRNKSPPAPDPPVWPQGQTQSDPQPGSGTWTSEILIWRAWIFH